MLTEGGDTRQRHHHRQRREALQRQYYWCDRQAGSSANGTLTLRNVDITDNVFHSEAQQCRPGAGGFDTPDETVTTGQHGHRR